MSRPSRATGALLGDEHVDVAIDPARVVRTDRARRGAVAALLPGGGVARAQPGPAGPLLLQAWPSGDGLTLAVRGHEATPDEARAAALAALRAWVGLDDDPTGFGELLADHQLLRRLHGCLGTPLLGRLPAIGEAVGRAVIAQLVQAVEAHRSVAQVAALLGTPAPAGLWCWPTRDQLGAAPAHTLRRCGVSLHGARALHAACVAEARLVEAADDPQLLDRRLRALPGIGVWTSAKVRAALGDPDAVPVGDYNLPTLVCHTLSARPPDGPAGRWTDEPMLEALAPFAGQRARVVRLIGEAMRAGMVPRPPRRAPRAALSAHRYH